MKKQSILRLTELAVLLAILLLLEVTGLGMFKTFGLEMTIMQLPVIIAAILIGPSGGAAVGLAFGLISFYECFGKSQFGAMLLGINPFLTFLVCVPTRTLMGWLCGLIFKAFDRKLHTKKYAVVSYGAAGLCGALLNTLLFMTALCLCFYSTDYIQSLAGALGSRNILEFAVLFVGLQGLVEALVCAVLGTAISRGVARALHR